MIKFVHTGDLHIGMPSTGLGEAGGKVRAARLESLGNILEIADDINADAILIAGDVFDDNQVDSGLVEKVANLLNDKTRIPIYIIPGNHDPYTRDSVYRRPVWGQLREHIQLLTTPESVDLAERVKLFPCPLFRKHGFEDPTAWIPSRDSEDIRIGLAHGSIPIRPGVGDDDFPIPLDAAETRQLDYLALGHWHSQMSHPYGQSDARTWYCGAHAATRFGQEGAGNVLAVTIDGPGAAPKVESIPCSVLNWKDYPINLSDVPLGEAIRVLRELPDAGNTLLRIKLTGKASGNENATVADLVAVVQERFLAFQVDDSKVAPASIDDLDKLLSSPYLRESAIELESAASGESTDDEPAAKATAMRALDILQEIAWRQQNDGK